MNKKLWSPSKDSRVCSNHFVDGKHTADNPMPTINMGYEGSEKRVHRIKLFELTKPSPTYQKPRKSRVTIKDTKTDFQFIETPVTEDPGDEILHKESPFLPVVFYVLFLSALKHCAHMKAENLKLKQENIKLKATVSELHNYVQFKELLKNNNDVNFYTGVPTLGLFNKLHNLIDSYDNRRWTGAKSALKTLRSYNHHTKDGPTRKL